MWVHTWSGKMTIIAWNAKWERIKKKSDVKQYLKISNETRGHFMSNISLFPLEGSSSDGDSHDGYPTENRRRNVSAVWCKSHYGQAASYFSLEKCWSRQVLLVPVAAERMSWSTSRSLRQTGFFCLYQQTPSRICGIRNERLAHEGFARIAILNTAKIVLILTQCSVNKSIFIVNKNVINSSIKRSKGMWREAIDGYLWFPFFIFDFWIGIKSKKKKSYMQP